MMKIDLGREHETLIRIFKDFLIDKGYEVKTENITEYAGFKSDMEAIKGNEHLCIDVINGNKIDATETKKKWQAISGNRTCDFCVFVTKEKEEDVKRLLKEWSIYFRKIWVYDMDKL